MQRFKDWVSTGLLGGWTYFVIIALYAPFIIMLILSFNDLTGGTTFPMRGLGLGWWVSLWDPTVVAKASGTGGGFTGTSG